MKRIKDQIKNQIRRKLKQETGASTLFALLAFLVATVIAATLISAAYTGAKRVNSDREANQNRLTLNSAALLVKSQMQETSVVMTTTKASDNPDEVKPVAKGEGLFADEMEAAVVKVENGISDFRTQGTGVRVQMDGMDPVIVTYVMHATNDTTLGSKKYDVVFTLQLEGSSEMAFLTMNPTSVVETSTKNDQVINTTTIHWNDGTIGGGDYE